MTGKELNFGVARFAIAYTRTLLKIHRSIFLMLLFSLASHHATAQQALNYETPVSLQGTIKTEVHYGPPNYGENPRTDKKERIFVLILAKSINVQGLVGDPINSSSIKGARVVQLVIPLETSIHEFIGKRVLVQGELFHAHTGHHHQALVMSVRSLERSQVK